MSCKLEVRRLVGFYPLGPTSAIAASLHWTETGRRDWMDAVEREATHQSELDLLTNWANAQRVLQREFAAYPAMGLQDELKFVVDGCSEVIERLQDIHTIVSRIAQEEADAGE